MEINSGRDIQVAGAYIEGQTVNAHIGRDLLISSTPDTGSVSGEEKDVDANVSIGYGSGSAGFGKTMGQTNWIDQQTSLIARDRLHIYVENHTQMDAALINSETGNLILDTNTLGYSNHQGIDREHGWYANAGGSWSKDTDNKNPSTDVSDKSQDNKSWSNNSGNLSGHNYRKDRTQNVLATIGKGETIVRNDRITGENSIAGINRDTNQAYQITYDYERNTQIYTSNSSIESAQNPDQTWEGWKEGLRGYTNNSIRGFDKMADLGLKAKDNTKNQEHKYLTKSIQLVDWIPGLLVKTANYLDIPGFHTGFIPTDKNNGGMPTQFFSLLHDRNEVLRGWGEGLTENTDKYPNPDKYGNIYLNGIGFVEFDGNFNKDEKIFINGMNTNKEMAIYYGPIQTGTVESSKENGFLLSYNRTHGFFPDLIESGVDKFLGAFRIYSGATRSSHQLLYKASIDENIQKLSLAAFSQGTLQMNNALRGINFEREVFNEKGELISRELRISYAGPALGAKQFHRAAENSGFKDEDTRLFLINREGRVSRWLPRTDSVADIIGGNLIHSENPVTYFIGGLGSVPGLISGNNSLHNKYSCTICKYDELDYINKHIWNSFPNPTLIDKNGNFRKRDEP